MGTRCTICTHAKRLEIDRSIVSGAPLARLAQKYAVNYHSLRRHAENHVTRQLSQAWHKKELESSFDLLHTIDDILQKTEVIFDRNFRAKKDSLALKALESKRQTIQLLANISYSLHQAKLTELEILKEKAGETNAEQKAEYMKGLDNLSIEELKLLQRLIDKAYNGTKEVILQPNTRGSDLVEFESERAITHSHKESRPEPPKIAEKATGDSTINDLKVMPIIAEQLPVTRRRKRIK